MNENLNKRPKKKATVLAFRFFINKREQRINKDQQIFHSVLFRRNINQGREKKKKNFCVR